jgi:tetratricopeptide (TPR) repeat protein
MRGLDAILKHVVAALFAAVFLAAPVFAQDPELEALFVELADPDNPAWARSEADIRRLWSHSGSAAMDLLYKRGEAALDAGDPELAIEHLTALTDHAPDFAEGWNLRSIAFFLEGEYGPSVADIARTLALEPRHWGALAGLGTILEDMGHQERALAAYRASFALHPHQENVKDAITRLQTALAGVSL